MLKVNVRMTHSVASAGRVNLVFMRSPGNCYSPLGTDATRTRPEPTPDGCVLVLFGKTGRRVDPPAVFRTSVVAAGKDATFGGYLRR